MTTTIKNDAIWIYDLDGEEPPGIPDGDPSLEGWTPIGYTSPDEIILESAFSGRTPYTLQGEYIRTMREDRVLTAYYGVASPWQTKSVLLRYEEEVPDPPKQPGEPLGFWRYWLWRLSGQRRREQARYDKDYLKWIAAGRPTRTEERKAYFPRAMVSPPSENDLNREFKITPLPF